MAIKSTKIIKQQLLAEDEPISNKTSLNMAIHILVNPETKQVEAVFYDSPLGVAEYDKDAQAWAPCLPEDTWRVTGLFNDSIRYVVDWNNSSSFDANSKSIAISKYSDGTLDEQWLEENTILANYPSIRK